jgi:4-hydroxythreonine-4-phosphate dehydrogenase
VFEFYRKRYAIPLTLLPCARIPSSWGRDILPVASPPSRKPFVAAPGRASAAAGALAGRTLGLAAELWKRGEIDGIVTGPLDKESLNAAGYRYQGQTEFLARATGSDAALMIMMSGALRIALATIHVPLRRVPAMMTRERLGRSIRMFARSLREDFGCRRPRIAVLGLNPHAGEGGLLGTEERDVIIPAVRAERRRGEAAVSGPHPADGFFASDAPQRFDGILAMYHDQGLIPLKMSGFGSTVNFTAGLPLVRTSPGHGTAYDIAGKGVASPGSAVAAILAAAEILAARSRGRKRR